MTPWPDDLASCTGRRDCPAGLHYTGCHQHPTAAPADPIPEPLAVPTPDG